MGFKTLNIVKMALSEVQSLTKTFGFRGHIPTFRDENKPKSETFKAKNNAKILLEIF